MSTPLLDPARPLTDVGGNLARRRRVDRFMRGGSTTAALFAVAVLGIMIATVAIHGASQISIGFLTKDPSQSLGATGGGIASAIVGTLLIVAVATVMATPLGVLIAIYLTEFSSHGMARPVRLALDLLNGTPSIVIGVFVYALMVEGGGGQTGFAASFALAVIMIPLIARSSGEMMRLVPKELRDASHGLGISRWRTIVGIVLPGAMGGIVTGTVLAFARAAGETAPLLFLSSIYSGSTTLNIFGQAIPNIPITILTDSESGFPSDHARAWGAALVLVVFILIGNLSGRAMLARQRRRYQAR
ncbi:MAG TPA: phosphate ABC transporter permease PstA [Solirubrobacteraceae bacterium]|nr:phosphate ABC transporter permease PstA [Solirubrobacteraceae bacterium]